MSTKTEMTLDQAIEHAKEAGERLSANCETKECGLEHLQLSEWLRELKDRRDRENREIFDRLSKKPHKYTFGLLVEGNDEVCMSMSKEETYETHQSMEIDAYNDMIAHCLNEGYSNFKVMYLTVDC